VYEGGIRVPLIARWPGRIEAGSSSDHLSAFWDVLPTLCDIAGVEPVQPIDGFSFAPTLLRSGDQKQHDSLYWEFPAYGGKQAVRMGEWKAVRTNLKRDNADHSIHLYNLEHDIGETTNLADAYPEIAELTRRIMRHSRFESELFPFPEVYLRKMK
jgi:arylsulfatase